MVMTRQLNGITVEVSEIEEAAILAERRKLTNAKEKVKYQSDRSENYPKIEDQMDMIYWDMINNTSLWTDEISRIKTKYPKP